MLLSPGHINVKIFRGSKSDSDEFRTPRLYELICEIQENGSYKWKFGDGITPYNNLPYVTEISQIEKFVVYANNDKDIALATIELGPERITTEELSDNAEHT